MYECRCGWKGDDPEVNKWEEFRGYYGDAEAWETVGEAICPNCGRKVEEFEEEVPMCRLDCPYISDEVDPDYWYCTKYHYYTDEGNVCGNE